MTLNSNPFNYSDNQFLSCQAPILRISFLQSAISEIYPSVLTQDLTKTELSLTEF
jgi:hypothetical protein